MPGHCPQLKKTEAKYKMIFLNSSVRKCQLFEHFNYLDIRIIRIFQLSEYLIYGILRVLC